MAWDARIAHLMEEEARPRESALADFQSALEITEQRLRMHVIDRASDT